MICSNSAVRTDPHEARFGPAISVSEYQKAVQILTLAVVNCEHGNSQAVT
jgi:hypothetical protein